MPLPRRRVLQLAAAGVGGAVFAPFPGRGASAAYPNRPVRLLVGYSAGSNLDILARLIGQWLSERLGQRFVVENRPGAGSNIATEAVVRAPPDGYTLLMVSAGNAVNATLYSNLSFDFLHDITPIAGLIRSGNVMVVNPSFPARTVPEFIAFAKANPGTITMASGGIGSGPHMAGETFKVMAGIQMRHVPYRGSPPALTDLMGGQVHVMFDLMASSIEQVRAGKLRALAVTTGSRSQLLPDVPTIAEFVPGYEASGWQGIGAPSNTPAEVVHTLNRQINDALADAQVKARLADIGGTVLGGSPAEFGQLISNETERWGKVIRMAGIQPE
jgi:tripartite-type tricarboxylate transporter receptor subunit TctC